MLYQEGCRKIPVQWLRTGRATPGYHVHGSPTMENSTKTILVVSAHAADFVWRAGGAIALYASRGYKVRILCLSYGERGESQGADEWAFASPPRRGSLSATQGDRRSSFPGVRCVYN